MINWQSPRGRGIVTVDDCAPHVRMWNEVLTFTWDGDELVEITREAPDGTVVSSTIVWSGGLPQSMSKYE